MLHLAALRNARQDMQERLSEGAKPQDVSLDDYDIPPPPYRYTLMKWRQLMHVTPQDAAFTPRHVIDQDLEMLTIETEFA